jgi:hypothetical protein
LSALQESARVFACARCGVLVVVCTRCDRGQIYCDGECREIRRNETERRAAKKFQATPNGALKHAKRQKRYRQKKAKLKAAASPPQRDQDGGQDSGSRVPGESPTRHSPVAGLPRGAPAFSKRPSLNTSPSVPAATPEPQGGNPRPVPVPSGNSTGVATLVPSPVHQSSADRHDSPSCPERISVESNVSEKIVTHQGSPEDGDRVRLGTLAPVADSSPVSAGRLTAGSTPRKPGSVSRCHFCGRPVSGFVRFRFLGSMEVP